jgi:hypothetical protein
MHSYVYPPNLKFQDPTWKDALFCLLFLLLIDFAA